MLRALVVEQALQSAAASPTSCWSRFVRSGDSQLEMRISLDRARTTHAAIDDAIAAFEGKPAPDGVVNLESLHVIVLFFTMVGMLLPVGVSTSVYWVSNTSYHEDATLSDGSEYDKYKYTVDGLMLEPFSAWANATYFTAGLGLFLLPFLSGDHMPAAVFGIALFLCILGGSSMSFHADGSRIGTWRHAADRFAMCTLPRDSNSRSPQFVSHTHIRTVAVAQTCRLHT